MLCHDKCASLRLEFMENPSPVSYTHLDVYKRQVVDRIEALGPAGRDYRIPLDDRAEMPALVAVGIALLYRYLRSQGKRDVYKRQCSHCASILPRLHRLQFISGNRNIPWPLLHIPAYQHLSLIHI